MTRDGTSYRDLQPGDERVYQALADAAQSGVMQLLETFKTTGNAGQILTGSMAEAFSREFFSRAEEFPTECCEASAKLMRLCAVVPDVRGLPTSILADEIRRVVFKPLDERVEAVRQLRAEMESVAAKVSTMDDPDPIRLQQMKLVFGRAELMIRRNISDYLADLDKVTEKLLDYCLARCLGGQVSLEQQQKAVDVAQAMISSAIEAATHFTEALPEAEEKAKQRRSATVNAPEEPKIEPKEMEAGRPAPRHGIALLALSVALTVWALSSCKVETADEGDIVWSLILLVGAGFALIGGVMKFFDRRPRSVRGANPGSDGPTGKR